MKREILIFLAVILLLTGAPGALWTWETLRPAQAAEARSGVQTAASPFLRLTAWASRKMKDSLEFLVITGQVRRQNKILMQEVARLKTENAVLRSTVEKNERLRSSVFLAELCGWEYVEADVVAYGGRPRINSLVLNRGARHGIREGDPALHMRGVAGVVIRVGPWTSTIQLLNNPEAALWARVPAFGARGLVQGPRRDDEMLTITLVDPLVELQPGHRVESSGVEGSLYPPGLAIGEVRERSDKDPFGRTTYEVEPAVIFRRIEEVLVLKVRRGDEAPGDGPVGPKALADREESGTAGAEAGGTSATVPVAPADSALTSPSEPAE